MLKAVPLFQMSAAPALPQDPAGTAAGQAVARDGGVGHTAPCGVVQSRRRRRPPMALQPVLALVVGHRCCCAGSGCRWLRCRCRLHSGPQAWSRSSVVGHVPRHGAGVDGGRAAIVDAGPGLPQLFTQLEPGRVLVLLPEMVESVTVMVPPAMFSIPPPAPPQESEQPALALLSEMVESETVRVPVASFSMPPPSAPQNSKQPSLALLLVTVASDTVRVPSFSIPPPELPQPGNSRCWRRRPRRGDPRDGGGEPGAHVGRPGRRSCHFTASWAAPGPVMVRLVVMSMGPEVRMMGAARDRRRRS